MITVSFFRPGCPRGGRSRSLARLAELLAFIPMLCAAGTEPQPSEPYPQMAATVQYLEPSRAAEIALARSAAPAAVSANATVLALTRQGYETAVKGTNGFTCLVERSWMSPFDSTDFWNPKVRGPVCYNAPASRSVLPYTLRRTRLALAGLSRARMFDDTRAASTAAEFAAPEPGSMSFMMSKNGYLGDAVGRWHSHLMFHVPKTDAAAWGANLPDSPIVLDTHREVPEPQTIFLVPLGSWSDGTPATTSATATRTKTGRDSAAATH